MAYVTISYKNHSFEESPGLVTWLQLYLLRRLSEETDAPEWTGKLAEDLELNAQIDIYKYFYDEDLLHEPEKETWALTFTAAALEQLKTFSLEEFADYIGEEIDPKVDFERIKKILFNVKQMVEGNPPGPTFPEDGQPT